MYQEKKEVFELEKHELDYTLQKINHLEGLVEEQEQLIAFYEAKKESLPNDEVQGYESAISNHLSMLQSFKSELAEYQQSLKADKFLGWD